MSSRHEQAKALFFAALDVPTADRAAFLEIACEHDPALKNEIESLLAFHVEEEGNEFASTPASTPIGRLFEPGALFANRYRIVRLLGRGGMGEVWQADDLVLGTAVALKLIHAGSPEGRDQILNEVRLARQITDPAVCRVFDVGEDSGEVFFSMELVGGEDLAALLKQVGRLPSERVVEIALQLCGGLSAAHAQGVLHRDLKPANVLIDEHGSVRITDFGIAISRRDTGPHAMVGTPGYMAPEQLFPGSPLTERTDLFALGLVLYELLTGAHPFADPSPASEPRRPSALVANVDPILERIVLQSLAADPRDRPASAADIAERLSAIAGGQRATPRWLASAKRRPMWLITAASAALVALLAIAGSLMFQRRAGALTAQDTILLADFTNTTGEPVFDGALKVGLAVGLEQSPFLKIFPDERVRETLRLMQRPQDQRVTVSIAREIAQREHLKALVAGSIVPLGRSYVLALEALNASSGDVMARQQLEASSKEQVLTALGRATARLREQLGESLTSIRQFDVPLPRATTSSLEALEAYSRALDQGRVTPRFDAIPHLKRAIELDPDFAMALALLSGHYANLGQPTLAPPLSQRAFELRDRVSERERYFISWRYYRDARQAWDKGLETARSWAMAYPRDIDAFNSLGVAANMLGLHEQALDAFRQAIRLDPQAVVPRLNLANSFFYLNRFDDMKQVLQQAEATHASMIEFRRLGFLLAFIEGDEPAMTRLLADARKMPEAIEATNWEAEVAAFGGRVHAAHDQYSRAVQVAVQHGFAEVAAEWTLEDAESHAAVGECREARAHAGAAVALSRDNFALARAGRTFGLCGAAEAVPLVEELAQRFPDATLMIRVAVPLTHAALAVHQGDAQRAITLLESARPYDYTPFSAFWPPYIRGQAYLQLKNAAAAATQFQDILDHRAGENADAVLYPLAALGLARAERLAGHEDKARQMYEAFLLFWKDADPNLQPLIDARRELAALQP